LGIKGIVWLELTWQ